MVDSIKQALFETLDNMEGLMHELIEWKAITGIDPKRAKQIEKEWRAWCRDIITDIKSGKTQRQNFLPHENNRGGYSRGLRNRVTSEGKSEKGTTPLQTREGVIEIYREAAPLYRTSELLIHNGILQDSLEGKYATKQTDKKEQYQSLLAAEDSETLAQLLYCPQNALEESVLHTFELISKNNYQISLLNQLRTYLRCVIDTPLKLVEVVKNLAQEQVDDEINQLAPNESLRWAKMLPQPLKCNDESVEVEVLDMVAFTPFRTNRVFMEEEIFSLPETTPVFNYRGTYRAFNDIQNGNHGWDCLLPIDRSPSRPHWKPKFAWNYSEPIWNSASFMGVMDGGAYGQGMKPAKSFPSESCFALRWEYGGGGSDEQGPHILLASPLRLTGMRKEVTDASPEGDFEDFEPYYLIFHLGPTSALQDFAKDYSSLNPTHEDKEWQNRNQGSVALSAVFMCSYYNLPQVIKIVEDGMGLDGHGRGFRLYGGATGGYWWQRLYEVTNVYYTHLSIGVLPILDTTKVSISALGVFNW